MPKIAASDYCVEQDNGSDLDEHSSSGDLVLSHHVSSFFDVDKENENVLETSLSEILDYEHDDHICSKNIEKHRSRAVSDIRISTVYLPSIAASAAVVVDAITLNVEEDNVTTESSCPNKDKANHQCKVM
ncbi:MAG: hypothetical protein JSR17_10390 [Proteobacteria bacterium]|nr:hypothetical protein [Pseudomonadota bacterium]